MGFIWLVAVVVAIGTSVNGCIPSPYYQQAYMPYGGGGMPYAAAASKSRMASDTHTYVGNSLDPFHAPSVRSGASKPHRDTNEQSQCVQQRFSNQRLECAASVERRVPLSTESECQRLCQESLLNCRAYQFDSIGMACDLYDEITVSRLFPSSSMPLHDEPSSPFEQEAVADDGDTADLNSYKQRHRRFTLHNGVESAVRRGGSSGAFAAPPAAVPQADSLLSSLFPQPSAIAPTAFAAPAATVPPPNSLLSSLFPQPSATASSAPNNPLDPLGFGNLLKSPLLNLPPPGPCEPKLQTGIGSTVVVVNPDCTLIETSSSLFPSPEPSPPVFLGGVEPFSKHSVPHVSIPTNYASSNLVDVLPGTETPDCIDGSRARVQLIDGISLVEERTIAKIQLDTAEHLDGNRFPRACKAATFDRASGRCSIVDEAISPNGELNYVPNPDSVYFEKICIPGRLAVRQPGNYHPSMTEGTHLKLLLKIPDSELPTGCDEVINRIPQHTLDSRAAGTGAVISTKSQIECIRRCVTAQIQRQLGFECASASFFFDWRTDNCYLSRFTRLNRPDIYIAERRQLVDYMELPMCMRRGSGTWQHDDVTAGPWSSWSECDAMTMTRSRHRNCSSCHPTVEKSVCSSRDLNMESPKQVTATLEKEPRKIATTMEAAKRLKPSAAGIVTPDQASLFGEQDYEHQAEVSYFGPPHKPTTSQPDGTVGSFKTAGAAHPLKSELGVKKNAAPSASYTHSSASSFTAADSKKCDSLVKCCPQANELKAMVWGCSVGVKTLSDGRNVPCLTEECH